MPIEVPSARPSHSSYVTLIEGLRQSVRLATNPYEAAFSADFLDLLDSSERVEGAVREAFSARERVDCAKDRKPVSPSYAGNLVLRAVHMQRTRQEDPDYPDNRKEVGSWREDISQIVVTDDFKFDIMVRDVVSTVASRYASLKVVANLLSERQKRPLRIMDIGASRNHGLKMLASDKPFEKPKKIPRGIGMRTFGHLLDRPVDAELYVGIDQFVARDEANKEWARACSLPPHEWKNMARVAQYDELEALNVPGLELIQAELGSESFETHIKEQLEVSKLPEIDIFNLSATIYQMSDKKLSEALDQMKKLMAEGGVILIHDFARVNESNITNLLFTTEWYNPSIRPFRTIVYDSRYPWHALTEIFRWTNGRCSEGTAAGLVGALALRRLRK
jgi:hypothetical protein